MRPNCRECWDPVDRDGAELCDWCAATPAQRRARMIRGYVGVAVGLALVCVALAIGLA